MKQQQSDSPKQARVEHITPETQKVLNELTQMQMTPPPLDNAPDLLNWEKASQKHDRSVARTHCCSRYPGPTR